MPSTLHEDVEALEEAVVAQWANFGQGPGGAYYEDAELAWTEAPVSQLPYWRSSAPPSSVRRFRARGVQFLWVVHPSAQPAHLEQLLPRHGLSLVARETGMALDLASWKGSAARANGPIVYK